ncbi:MAG: hypothetical protein R3C56_39785 [Pirellulaceae bacterium]
MSQQHSLQPGAMQTAAPLFASATSEPPRVKNARDLSALEQIITQQNQLMSMQLQLLSGRGMAAGTPQR